MSILKTKYGNINIESTSSGISKISFRAKSQRREAVKKPVDKNMKNTIALLTAYFKGKKVDLKVKYDISYLPLFTQKVLRETKKIPYGKTIAYSEIAKRIGCPKASRAVGQALGCNPVPILIPCHRVIRKDKSLGGFAAGLQLKKVLLDLESGK